MPIAAPSGIGIVPVPVSPEIESAPNRGIVSSYAALVNPDEVDGPFPEFIDFVNDQDVVVRLRVEYEWKPLKCNHCKMFGHIEEECRKKVKTRREWREVQNHSTVPRDEGSTQPQGAEKQYDTQTLRPDIEGFITVRRPAPMKSPSREREPGSMRIQNPFKLLQDPQGCLLETKVKEKNTDRIATRLFQGWQWQYNFHLNTKGRIWVAWRPKYYKFIHCKVTHTIIMKTIYLTFVYEANQEG
ncbi:hypothetical protein Cgig2_010629 [Carnegiea gigantea]|uniref:Uncharacterized protein n=1 Tax=Carnegiea gigantea TaxID=171969 RepID=A0A9Q1GKY5_9CARY|nr:hypothetical protein Cgig2_010629 [Carnegiea gigantea]